MKANSFFLNNIGDREPWKIILTKTVFDPVHFKNIVNSAKIESINSS